MGGHQIAFIIIAAITVLCALMVVLAKNILRASLFLAAAFLGVAGLYILANAEFVAAMQVLVYVGAITVLIMFGLVLTQQLMGAKLQQVTRIRAILFAVPVAGLAFAFIVKAFIQPFEKSAGLMGSAPNPVNEKTLQDLAQMLLQPYVLPFELASLILLAALVGAIVMAKEDKS